MTPMKRVGIALAIWLFFCIAIFKIAKREALTPPYHAMLMQDLTRLSTALTRAHEQLAAAPFASDAITQEQKLRSARLWVMGDLQKQLLLAQSHARMMADEFDGAETRILITQLSVLVERTHLLEQRLDRHLMALGNNEWSAERLQTQTQELLMDSIGCVESGERLRQILQTAQSQNFHLLSERREQSVEQLKFLACALSAAACFALAWLSLMAPRSQQREHKMGRILTEIKERNAAFEHGLEAAEQTQRRTALELALLRLEQKSLIESLRSALLFLDESLQIKLSNRAARTLFHLSDHDSALLSVKQLAPLLEALGGHLGLSSAMQAGQRLSVNEFCLPINGREVWLFVTCAPYLDESGKARGMMLIADDMSEEVLARSRLMQHERLATMGKLGAQVAHEIRNPLSAIALNVDLLAEEMAESGFGHDEIAAGQRDQRAEMRALINAIATEVDRLTVVTNDYLRLTRLNPLRKRGEDLRMILDELLTLFQENFNHRHIRVHFEAPPGETLIEADSAQLKQAFMNIVKNAIESMPQGGEIQVRLSTQNRRAVVEIEDSGLGMDEGQLSKIFDPFYTTKESGTGLGLAITQHIVEEHEGVMTCASAPGKGTCISVSFACLEASFKAPPPMPNAGFQTSVTT